VIKEKMKRQILAILAIVAVLIALLTVSALSNEEGYKVTPCDAIDISLETTAVTDFLNATNMTTVQVYNFKGYKGENTWMVQWYSSNRLLDNRWYNWNRRENRSKSNINANTRTEDMAFRNYVHR
jgi:hypothetical protein